MDSLFDKIKKDVKKGIEEGIAAVKQGANIVSGKMSELTAEGKRQYKIFDLKSKIQSQMTELGGRTYDALNGKQSPAADNKIKTAFVKIKKLEEHLRKLEGGIETKTARPKKPAAKTKAAAKKIVRASAKKTVAKTAGKTSVKK
jgi:hypothetical protein